MLRTAEEYAEIAEGNGHHIIVFLIELKPQTTKLVDRCDNENELPCLL